MAVILYSTPTCTYCRTAKQYFQQKRIPYTEFDVSSDQRRADEMLRKSRQMGVPVIDIHGKIIVGFDKPQIERALKR